MIFKRKLNSFGAFEYFTGFYAYLCFDFLHLEINEKMLGNFLKSLTYILYRRIVNVLLL